VLEIRFEKRLEDRVRERTGFQARGRLQRRERARLEADASSQ
jgi:hypothetical protein